MATWKKVSMVSLIVLEQMIQRTIGYLTKFHDGIMSKLMDLVFYHGTPGEVTFGIIHEDEEYRADGYIFFRDYDRRVVRIPFKVQHPSRREIWDARYIRSIATQAFDNGLNILWIEHDNKIASPTTAQWMPKGEEFRRIQSLFA